MFATEASCNPFHLIFMTSALLVLLIFKSICVSAGGFQTSYFRHRKNHQDHLGIFEETAVASYDL